MDRNRIITMKTILKKESGEYLYKQNRASAFNGYLETINEIYYSFHKRNQMIFEGIKKSVSADVKYKIKISKKMHVIFIHDPMNLPKEEIYEKYIIKKNISEGEAVLFIDVLPGRFGEFPENGIVYAYWSARDVASNYASYMSFMYHLITDMFSVVKMHMNSQVYGGDVVIDFNHGLYLMKKMRSSFKPELKKRHEWSSLRTILNDRFSSLDSISSDPLANTSVFKACADDFFLLFRVMLFDIYTGFLREDSINTKNRIDTIKERISQAELSLLNDETDKELEEMNDILNTRLDEGGV